MGRYPTRPLSGNALHNATDAELRAIILTCNDARLSGDALIILHWRIAPPPN